MSKILAAVVMSAALLPASATAASTTVETGHALGKKVLVTPSGRTLYSLSAETNGRFICKGSCLSTWHPLVIKAGKKPTGAHSLGTIRRPGGQTQVTYRGKPLYTFAGDHKRGDAKGEGFKDVGTWHVASVGTTTNSPAAPAPAPSYPGYGY